MIRHGLPVIYPVNMPLRETGTLLPIIILGTAHTDGTARSPPTNRPVQQKHAFLASIRSHPASQCANTDNGTNPKSP
jgi:hypothetical protein